MSVRAIAARDVGSTPEVRGRKLLRVRTDVEVEVIGRGWLRRELAVRVGGSRHLVVYDGRGFGYESVIFDGYEQSRAGFWFAPRFEANVASRRFAVEVRVSPWLTLSDLRLFVDGELVYSEGPLRPLSF